MKPGYRPHHHRKQRPVILSDKAGTQADPSEARRNFRLGVVNGVIYIGAETLLDPTLVLVSFLTGLTQSPLLLGLVIPIRDGAWSLPQMWLSAYMQSQPHKIRVYRILSIFRTLAWGSLVLVINLIRDPDWLLAAFFISFSIASLTNGLAGLPFLEVVGKTIAPIRRGEFFAWRLGLGGLAGIFAALLVRWLIGPESPIAYPQNYGLLSLLFFILATFSLFSFNQIREPVEQDLKPRVSFKTQMRRAIEIIREDPVYRRYLGLQTCLTISAAATPFFAVYVQQELGASKGMVGVYLAALTAANLFSNILFGRISGRVGYRKVLFWATSAGLAMTLIVFMLSLLAEPLSISAGFAGGILIISFIFAGLRGSGIGVSGTSFLMEIAPAAERSIYLGFNNTYTGLVMLATGLSGVVLKLFGFQFLFGLAVLMHLAAFYLGARLIGRVNLWKRAQNRDMSQEDTRLK